MASRGGPARRLTGNPLGGMLRDLDRRTRSTTRRSRPTPPAGQPGEGRQAPLPPLPPPPPVLPSGPVAAVVATGEDGRARWTYPAPLAAPPVLAAVAIDPAPEDEDRTVSVALEEVTAAYAVVRVWRTRPRRGTGVSSPVGEGVRVHLTAYAPGT
ncbi:hypothetical protein [Streptomyces sp. OE57]|uniref:hypothetical protein n=1 Tax=Streptomyces lacaronensis TaxID=3379885 RepID=UPI0039B76841